MRGVLRPWAMVVAATAFALGALTVAEARQAGSDADLARMIGSLLWAPAPAWAPWTPRPMRLGRLRPPPKAEPGPLVWRTLRAGFEVADLNVMVGTEPIDRIRLVRLEPSRFRFAIRNDPSRRHTLRGWMRDMPDAALVINGAYYVPSGAPATPTLIDGVSRGATKVYRRDGGLFYTHGAFIASAAGAVEVVDIKGRNWKDVFAGQDQAFVSFPLLVAAGAPGRANESSWVANRTFVAQDRQGRLIFGVTETGFFTLKRLGEFLSAAPLDIVTALALDGGPLTGQGVAVGDYRSLFSGRFELKTTKGPLNIPIMRMTAPGLEAPLPIVIAAFPRD